MSLLLPARIDPGGKNDVCAVKRDSAQHQFASTGMEHTGLSATSNGAQNGALNDVQNSASNGGQNGASNGAQKSASSGAQNGISNGALHRASSRDSEGAQASTCGSGTAECGINQLLTGSVEEGYRFLGELVPVLVQEALGQGIDVHRKVVEFHHPKELKTILDLDLSHNATDNDTLLQLCRQIIRYSVRTGHPRFFNQLFGGRDVYGTAGAWLTEALNTSAYTYEVAPVFTLMENVVMAEMIRLIGFTEGDGMFCPGGSMSNMYAMNLARCRRFPDVKQTGTAGLPPMVVLTSEKGHYSITKGAGLLGLGTDNVVKIQTDPQGRMCPQALDHALTQLKAQGRVPIMVNATAGSTVLGSYDPLQEVADVCEKHGGVWLHADGAWGGAVLLSPRLRHKMKGIERCDSMTWNPHKMMGAPLQCSLFFTKHKGLLATCHSARAKYLFQQDKFYDVSWDTGDKSLQCGRKVDVLKLWLMWKARGTQQLAHNVEHLFQCAQYLTNKLKTTEGFRLVLEEPECTNVCFWFIPPSVRGQPETQQWRDKLAKVAPIIKQRMVEEGTMLIGYQPDGDRVNFFRMVLVNPAISLSDMDFVLAEITRLGHDL